MAIIQHSNGVKSIYDETIKVGDLVTAYEKGFHRVTEIKPRRKDTPLIMYVRVFGANGKPVSSKQHLGCDAAYVRKASERLAEINADISNLQNLVALIEKEQPQQ